MSSPLPPGPFTFLGGGGQAYAFLSADGEVVLKLFKRHQLHLLYDLPPLALCGWLEAWRQKGVRDADSRQERTCASFGIAWELLRKETGLLYLHLAPTTHLQTRVTLVDPLGIRHEVDLDSLPFALQRHGEPAYRAIERLMAAGQSEAAAAYVRSLLSLLERRAQLGLSDYDPIISRNFGRLDDEAFELDIGAFTLDRALESAHQRRRDLFFAVVRFQEWLSQRWPLLAEVCAEELWLRMTPTLDPAHFSPRP
jgi:hypothetical protein